MVDKTLRAAASKIYNFCNDRVGCLGCPFVYEFDYSDKEFVEGDTGCKINFPDVNWDLDGEDNSNMPGRPKFLGGLTIEEISDKMMQRIDKIQKEVEE